MTAQYPNFAERRRADAIARNFTREAVSGRREEAMRFLQAGLDFIRAGQECGADLDYLTDVAGGLRDTVSNIGASCQRDLDNAGAQQDWRPIDTADLDTLLGTLLGRIVT